MNLTIQKMRESDWSKVSDIYRQGINSGIATFERHCPSYPEFDASRAAVCRLVILDGGTVTGWCTLASVFTCCISGAVAEVSVYIEQKYHGKGLGTLLLARLTEESEKHGFWTLQSNIMNKNPASIHLHEKCGFRLVGWREQIARDRSGNWQDTVLMEKRSKILAFDQQICCRETQSSCCSTNKGCC